MVKEPADPVERLPRCVDPIFKVGPPSLSVKAVVVAYKHIHCVCPKCREEPSVVPVVRAWLWRAHRGAEICA